MEPMKTEGKAAAKPRANATPQAKASASKKGRCGLEAAWSRKAEVQGLCFLGGAEIVRDLSGDWRVGRFEIGSVPQNMVPI